MPVRRPGGTVKLSISLDAADIAALRRIARRRYNGNLSGLLADGVRLLREEEGRQALLSWIGKENMPTPEQAEAIRREWGFDKQPARRRPRKRPRVA
jgi:hypothetical protein